MTDATPLPDAFEKMCSKCRQTKPMEFFYRRSSSKDGRGPWCKACFLAHRRAKPNAICQVDGCERVTTMGQRKCDPCYADAPPMEQAHRTRGIPHRTRGMPRYNDQGNRLCSHCLTYLSVSDFPVHNRVQDRLSRVCRTCIRANYVEKKYGLTLDQAETMWASPCSICGFFEAETMAIDHCHSSGKVRGTLCHPCNVSIGHFMDDPDLLEKAAQYLRSFGHGQANQDHPEQSEVRHVPRAKGWSTHKRRRNTSP